MNETATGKVGKAVLREAGTWAHVQVRAFRGKRRRRLKHTGVGQ
jgi:hypothetical protein